MQTKLISRLSALIVIVITLYVIAYGIQKSLSIVPFPEFDLFATSTTPIRTPGGLIRAIVASTSVDRSRGLSGRASLPPDTGMLFVFPSSGTHGFWMKDMLFSIDIIWVDEEKRVVSLLRDVSPETYPEVFLPKTPARYVLELDSGGADEWGIATGTQLVF